MSTRIPVTVSDNDPVEVKVTVVRGDGQADSSEAEQLIVRIGQIDEFDID